MQPLRERSEQPFQSDPLHAKGIQTDLNYVVDLMDALKKSIASETSATGRKPRKAFAGQKEMLLPIEGKKPAAKKAAKPERSTGRRTAG